MTDELKAAVEWLREAGGVVHLEKAEAHARVILAHLDGEAASRREWERNHLNHEADDAKAERDEWKARAEKAEAERDALRQRILDSCPSPDEGGRIHAGGRIVCGQCHDSEVRHLTNERDAARAELTHERANGPTVEEWRRVTAERDEAVRALRGLARGTWLDSDEDTDTARGYVHSERLYEARAVLAKHSEGT